MINHQPDKLALAISIAASSFSDKFDKAGRPYILHCLAVMYNIKECDDELRIIAALHDLLEDTDYTLEELKSLGFSQRVLDALSLLNHHPLVSYDAYIAAICTNIDAIRVKIADIKHNTDVTRLKGLNQKDFDRMQKYHRSYVKLQQALNNFPSN